MKKSNKSILVVALIVVVALGLLGSGNIAALFGGSGGSGKTTRELVMSCTLDMYTAFHIHPHLTIIINGRAETVPPNVGISLGCMHPLHTHGGDGVIHVESPEKRDFTLDDFFAVWGKTFTKDQILDYKADATREVVMTVNGAASTEYENLVLGDKNEIKIEYKNR